MGDPISLGVGAVGATANAFKLVKSFVDVRDATKVQALKFELQGLLLEAQEAQAALVADKRQLEEHVRDLEAWNGEKERYQLEKIGPSESLCYGLKADAQGSEPDHKLCAHCYEHRLKRYLQPHTVPEGQAKVLACHECGSQIRLNGVVETRVIAPAKKPTPKAGTFGRGSLGRF